MLELRDVTKRYGQTTVLEHVTFSFPARGLVCIMGPSGAGKSTLLNLLAGFDRDYEGEIRLDGLVLSDMDPDALCEYRRTEVGFVFQDYCLISGYTALENVLMASALNATSEEDRRARAERLLGRVGLGDKASQHAKTLSGGQKQRVAIARALMGSPTLILADEPTGALDRATSGEIMDLLCEIAHERLVVVITHDEKLLPFADDVLHIEDGRLVADGATTDAAQTSFETTEPDAIACTPEAAAAKDAQPHVADAPAPRAPVRALATAAANFRAHAPRLVAIAAIISLGLLAVLLSLSCRNVERQSIERFKQSNPVFGNGYIKGGDTAKALSKLRADGRVADSYNQYVLNDVGLSLDGKQETMAEKLPLPKATESLSYGTMPREGREEIALTPSLAKKFAANIHSLLGKQMQFDIGGTSRKLRVSGIYNAGYDDFFISSDIERDLYEGMQDQQVYSISYDVPEFDDVLPVRASLRALGFEPTDASAEVKNLSETFANVNRLFLSVAVLVCAVALFLCAVLLVRLQGSRVREMGLLSALGFRRRDVAAVIRFENLMLAGLAAVMCCVLVGLVNIVASLIAFPIEIGVAEVALSSAAAFATVLIVSALASARLLRADPARALRG
ncbi:ABC transporter related protein [Coriobacterium glomerans PW2]|uniref:ABC transporter related protein n=1 Tax=Coriobacterium glomerans (strain ATCC 49209 / DSM 20642 / JCM 10262 / PW2) TaxID=700015 RepID=F2N908_CORGP|nr:ABC transporter ATP-binding protein/permease [Coriobacterium glomerans]AEB07608.1 ABC transporter related protein [Coriobacterium glomerans PW2]